MFLFPNELRIEALSPLILPLICLANACVTVRIQARFDLNLRNLKRFHEKPELGAS